MNADILERADKVTSEKQSVDGNENRDGQSNWKKEIEPEFGGDGVSMQRFQ